MNEVCVIGGSRYFGRHVIERLLADGVAVTVVNRGSAAAPAGAAHVVTDRDDEAALRAALGSRTFDVVLDQVCYTPRQAEITRRVLTGRTARYVMTSTIEVYDPASSNRIEPVTPGIPVAEDSIDLTDWHVDTGLPWHDPAFRDAHYGEGKRQAEAVLAAAPFAFASVRSAHVLGGGDFTGRLAHYLERIAAGEPIGVHRVNHRSSFITDREIADVLGWALRSDFNGPVNAASNGELDVTDICTAIADAGVGTPSYSVLASPSPYAFDRYYAMDNGRASALGFRFGESREWLDQVIGEALAERVVA